MRRTFETTFTSKITGKKVVYKTTITDREEPRDRHKKALAINYNRKKLQRNNVRVGMLDGILDVLWEEETIEIK